MKKAKFNILYILIPLSLIVFISICSIIYISKKTIKYYKCPEKPHSEMLEIVLNQYGFERGNYISDLYMPCGYTGIEDELEEKNIKSKYIFGLMGCDQIVSKNNLWNILEVAFGREGASKIMPESYLLDDVDQLTMAIQKIMKKQVLICKKNLQRKLGLKLIFNENELVDAVKDDFTVAQIFLKDTMQIKGRKINLRVYYLVKKIGKKLEFYVNLDGKVLYTSLKTTGPITFESHITSYKMEPDLYERENLPHNFYQLAHYIGFQKYQRIWMNIMRKIKYFSNAIAYVFNEDKYNSKVCFQLFGMDVILDGEDPYILEVNKGPDMIPKCDQDRVLKKRIYEEVFETAGLINRHFKQNNFIKLYSYKLE